LGGATVTDVSASLTGVTIEATGLEEGTDYELTIPAGVVLGPTKVGNSEIRINFSTEAAVPIDITTTLSVTNPSAQAQNVYGYLLENYGTRILSSTMANVNWNINEAEWVNLQTGKYPAIAAFDYIHFIESPANWIDYSNTTVVEDWWNNNGLVAAGWHWRVPTSEGATTYTYRPEETSFSAANATVDGSWENDVVKADLAKIGGYLKLLQSKNIPVIWRPLHEAAGNIYEYTGGAAWFWWGAAGADAYKALWQYMFDYFETEGLNNLIWVWTTQTGDADFYPGDAYVDIVGRDIYDESDASAIAGEFEMIQETYSNKMVTLSECGNVATISDQWTAGAKWSYFMPWYDYDRTNDTSVSDFSSTEHEYANAAWWTDAVNNDMVITRDEMPDLK
jgi:mannan endo-1,4-beta-mannosidase